MPPKTTVPQEQVSLTEVPPSETPSTRMSLSDSMRPFFVLWTGQALSLIGSQAVQFAIIWWLTIQTQSAAILAAATFVGLFPQVVLGPLIGALVDRWNRKRIMLLADAGIAVASGLLALLFLTGNAGIIHVFALLLVRALGAAFHAPAMLASTTLMVPKQHLTRIQGLNQAVQGGLLIISAPLGALLYASLSMAVVMTVDIATALVAILPLIWIRVPQPETGAAKVEPGAANHPMQQLVSEMVAGFLYLWQRNGHFALLTAAALINLLMVPAFSLLPLLVSERGGSALELGWMTAGFGVGTIVGGVALGVWGGFKRRIVTTLTALVGVGIATMVLSTASASTFLVSLAAIFGVGAMIALTNGPIQAILQATVPPEYQGRVFTLYGSLAGIAAPIGLVLAAPVADRMGIAWWYLAAGAMCILMGAIGLLTPSLMKIEEGTQI